MLVFQSIQENYAVSQPLYYVFGHGMPCPYLLLITDTICSVTAFICYINPYIASPTRRIVSASMGIQGSCTGFGKNFILQWSGVGCNGEQTVSL